MRFVILDTGIGMSTDQIDLAVQPFGQPNRAADPSERGCGLGLPLACRLAELHLGELTVESEQGKGCRVIVDIPCRQPLASVVRAA
jgi:two-component system cell cycle sensor histidine kinase PleC